MRVYAKNTGAPARPVTNLFVCPANDCEGSAPASDWLHEDGTPIQFTVRFEHGQATVSTSLGKYLVARGYAQSTRLILPPGVAA